MTDLYKAFCETYSSSKLTYMTRRDWTRAHRRRNTMITAYNTRLDYERPVGHPGGGRAARRRGMNRLITVVVKVDKEAGVITTALMRRRDYNRLYGKRTY